MALLLPRKNPLLQESIRDPRVDATQLADATHLSGPERRAFIKRFVRGQSAKEALAEWAPPLSIFGFTKGQFSLIDIIEELLEKIGPSHLSISTWTAGNADVLRISDLLASGKLEGLRLLVDGSFAQRQPDILKSVVRHFGNSSLRVCNNHAKFFVMDSGETRVACKTSMNLNLNPRFEDFDITCDQELCDFLERIMRDLWEQSDGPVSKQKAMALFPHQLTE
jgi:hypothetical protein